MRNAVIDWIVGLGLLDWFRGRRGRIGSIIKRSDVRWIKKQYQ